MGCLHEGHLRLVDRARELADRVVVSVYVNPTQFGVGDDFERYGRNLERDTRLSEERGAVLLFAPSDADMYPSPQDMWVDPGPLARRLCGRSRPGHFRGVMTVVLKLLQIVDPDVALFGRKDYQQLVLVRHMVQQLNLRVHIESAAIVRESDGVAMSSRNAMLSPADHQRAVSLSRGLRRVREAFANDVVSAGQLTSLALETMTDAGVGVDYADVVDPWTLESVSTANADSVCALAAYVGPARLIDNAVLGGEEPV